MWELAGEIGISKTEHFIGNTSKRAQGHGIGRKLKRNCLLFRWLKCRVTWTLLLSLLLHLLLLHHNKAAWDEWGSNCSFLLQWFHRAGITHNRCASAASPGFIYPLPSSLGWWRAGTPSAFIWAKAVSPINTRTRGAVWCGEPLQPHNASLLTTYSTTTGKGREGDASSFASM